MKIPIGDARELARKHNAPMVVVFAITTDGEQFCVTTYGATKKLCKLAASYGDQFAEAVLNGRVSVPSQETMTSKCKTKSQASETGGAELCVDDETGKPYWALWGEGWKDGEDMDPGEQILLHPDTFPPGTRLVILEPDIDSKVSRKFYESFGTGRTVAHFKPTSQPAMRAVGSKITPDSMPLG